MGFEKYPPLVNLYTHHQIQPSQPDHCIPEVNKDRGADAILLTLRRIDLQDNFPEMGARLHYLVCDRGLL